MNDTLRNLSPMMDFALKDDTLRGGKSPKAPHKTSNSSMIDNLKEKASSLTPSPLLLRKSLRIKDVNRKKYNTISVFPRSLVETTSALLVTEDT